MCEVMHLVLERAAEKREKENGRETENGEPDDGDHRCREKRCRVAAEEALLCKCHGLDMVMAVRLEDMTLQPSPARPADAVLPPMDKATEKIGEQPTDEGLSKEGENGNGDGLC